MEKKDPGTEKGLPKHLSGGGELWNRFSICGPVSQWGLFPACYDQAATALAFRINQAVGMCHSVKPSCSLQDLINLQFAACLVPLETKCDAFRYDLLNNLISHPSPWHNSADVTQSFAVVDQATKKGKSHGGIK